MIVHKDQIVNGILVMLVVKQLQLHLLFLIVHKVLLVLLVDVLIGIKLVNHLVDVHIIQTLHMQIVKLFLHYVQAMEQIVY